MCKKIVLILIQFTEIVLVAATHIEETHKSTQFFMYFKQMLELQKNTPGNCENPIYLFFLIYDSKPKNNDSESQFFKDQLEIYCVVSSSYKEIANLYNEQTFYDFNTEKESTMKNMIKPSSKSQDRPRREEEEPLLSSQKNLCWPEYEIHHISLQPSNGYTKPGQSCIRIYPLTFKPTSGCQLGLRKSVELKVAIEKSTQDSHFLFISVDSKVLCLFIEKGTPDALFKEAGEFKGLFGFIKSFKQYRKPPVFFSRVFPSDTMLGHEKAFINDNLNNGDQIAYRNRMIIFLLRCWLYVSTFFLAMRMMYEVKKKFF